jgi:hypothetical protein
VNLQQSPMHLQMIQPGVHLVSFTLKPLIHRGFDILVDGKARNLLPSVELPLEKLDQWQMDLLKRYNNWTAGDLIDLFRTSPSPPAETNEERQFLIFVFHSMLSLAPRVGESLFRTARLIAQPLYTQCAPDPLLIDGPPREATLIAFRVISDVHQARFVSEHVTFVPSRFFLTQQHVYQGTRDHAIFARRVNREFSQFQTKPRRNSTRNSLTESKPFRVISKRLPKTPIAGWGLSSPTKQHFTGDSEASSQKPLVAPVPADPFNNPRAEVEATGEITETIVDYHTHGIEMGPITPSPDATVSFTPLPVEAETYVDELMALTMSERRHADHSPAATPRWL